MTVATDVARDARRLRALLALAFVATVVAPGVSTWLALRHDSANRSPAPSVVTAPVVPAAFPPDSGMGSLVAEVVGAAGARSLHGTLHVGRGNDTWSLELLCDTGTATVVAGGLSSSEPCTGQVQDLVTVPLPGSGSVAVTVTVDAAQYSVWGVAAYR